MPRVERISGEVEVLFELAGVGVVQTDLYTGRFLRANPTFCELVGYSETELQGMTYLELTHPDDRARDGASFAALQLGERATGTSLTRCLRKDGCVVWLELHITVLGEGDKAINLTVVKDVTERKRHDANTAFLVAVADDFSRLIIADEIMQVVGEKLSAHLGSATLNFLDVDEARGELRVNYFWGRSDVPSLLGTFRIKDFLTEDWERASRAGELTVIGNTQTDPRTDARAYAALDIGSFIAVPFHRHGEWRYCLAVSDPKPRSWRDDEVELIRELTARIFPRIERARAEAALRESEARYRTLFNAMDEGFGVAEMIFGEGGRPVDLRWLEVNPQFERLTGLPHTEVLSGKTVRQVAPGLEDHWFEAYGRVAQTGEPVRFEAYAAALERWFDVYAFRLGEPHGRRVAVLFRDVTAHKRAEVEREHLLQELKALNATLEQQVEARTEALRQSERRFSQAFHAGPVATCITTLDRDSHRETFLEVNEMFTQLTGYTCDEALGYTAHELGMWSSPEDQRKLEAATQDGGSFHNLALQLTTRTGTVRDVLLSCEVIDLEGEHAQLKLFYDVTEQKRSEEQLYKAIQEVMSDTAWFSRSVMERLAHIRAGQPEAPPSVELTQRERQVLSQLAQGKDNETIATELGLARQTVRNYISVLYDKLGVHSRAEAVVWARERGIT